ncbi:hypothetical protein MPC1_7310003 [Methylocella tundrae]|nr:hypothetical protein MPC1_7310003 [Methylocella tundrae]
MERRDPQEGHRDASKLLIEADALEHALRLKDLRSAIASVDGIAAELAPHIGARLMKIVRPLALRIRFGYCGRGSAVPGVEDLLRPGGDIHNAGAF